VDGLKIEVSSTSDGYQVEPRLVAPLISPFIGNPPFAIRPTTAIPAHAVPPRPIEASTTHTLSPLYSSSSSSDAPEDSFLHLDTLDPFSRFWGALETMLDGISNPVAFASAPLDLPPIDETLQKAKKGSRGKRKEPAKTGKGKGEAGGRSGFVP